MKPQDIDTIVRLLREEASEISAKDYARIMMREAATTIVALASELAAKDEQVRTGKLVHGPAAPEHVPEALDAATRAERERVLALARQMCHDCQGLHSTDLEANSDSDALFAAPWRGAWRP